MIAVVDIGGTKTLVSQFSDEGKPINEVCFPTNNNFETFYDELNRHLSSLENTTAISIGVPCMVDSSGMVLRCGNLSWQNIDLKKRLKRQFDCPVYIENDARLAAISEINALSPVPKIGMYLTVSTGIGGGVVVDGELSEDVKQTEPGHMVFEFEGKLQEWEDFASGQAIKKHFGRLASQLDKPEEWEWVVERLAVGLVALIPTIQPEVIVIGGGVGSNFEKFGQQLQKRLKAELLPYISVPPIYKAKHATEAVLYGAYHYARLKSNN